MEISVSELRVIRKGMWENEHKEDDIKYLKTKGRQWCGFSDNTDVF